MAAQHAVHAAEANAKLAIANGTADPTLGAEYDRSGNDNSAGFQFNIPLRIFDRNQGEKERTRFEAESVSATTLSTAIAMEAQLCLTSSMRFATSGKSVSTR